jgi:hypothetical protein
MLPDFSTLTVAVLVKNKGADASALRLTARILLSSATLTYMNVKLIPKIPADKDEFPDILK